MAVDSTIAASSEAVILARILDQVGDIPAEAAPTLLRLDFSPSDRDRMNALAAKARRGALTEAEDRELTGYLNVGRMIGVLQSRARKSLRDAGLNSGAP